MIQLKSSLIIRRDYDQAEVGPQNESKCEKERDLSESHNSSHIHTYIKKINKIKNQSIIKKKENNQ